MKRTNVDLNALPKELTVGQVAARSGVAVSTLGDTLARQGPGPRLLDPLSG